MQIEVVRTVAAPPPSIFAAVADIPRWPRIFRRVSGIELLTPGPVRIGTRLREQGIMLGHEATVTMEVSILNPPHRLLLIGENRSMRWDRDFVIDAVASQPGSRVMLIFRSRPESAIGRALQPLMEPFLQTKLRDELEQDLADLAATAATHVSSG